MRCGCENSHCEINHADGQCVNVGDPKYATMSGDLCQHCVPYMPAQYIHDESDNR